MQVVVLGIGCITVSLRRQFSTPGWRPYRASLFAGVGMSAVVPVVHGVWRVGVRQLEDQVGLSWLALQYLVYGAGAMLYAVSLVRRTVPPSLTRVTSCVSRRGHDQDGMTPSVPLTRCCTSVLSWPSGYIWSDC